MDRAQSPRRVQSQAPEQRKAPTDKFPLELQPRLSQLHARAHKTLQVVIASAQILCRRYCGFVFFTELEI